jgi:hypothetical protein
MMKKSSSTSSKYFFFSLIKFDENKMFISDFSLDPDLLRELNVRYLHDINIPRNNLSTYSRNEHHHQHTHEHNLNILTPPNDSSVSFIQFFDKESNEIFFS